MSESPQKSTGGLNATPQQGEGEGGGGTRSGETSSATRRGRSPTPDDLAQPSPPFHELVMLLEEISKKSGKKRELLDRFIKVSLCS